VRRNWLPPNHPSRLATSPQVAYLVPVAASWCRSDLAIGISVVVALEFLPPCWWRGTGEETKLPYIGPLPPALFGLVLPPKMGNTRGTTAAFPSSGEVLSGARGSRHRKIPHAAGTSGRCRSSPSGGVLSGARGSGARETEKYWPVMLTKSWTAGRFIKLWRVFLQNV
jgi:hypothetical protein